VLRAVMIVDDLEGEIVAASKPAATPASIGKAPVEVRQIGVHRAPSGVSGMGRSGGGPR
jgi:hypothetical protein